MTDRDEGRRRTTTDTITFVPHQESVRPGWPPTLFGATRGLGRLGAWALPSEAITFASMLSTGALMLALSVRRSSQFFFRMPEWWMPLACSASAAAVCVVIAWRGSLRPGPKPPRFWVAGLGVGNLALVVVEALAAFMRRAPAALLDPFPWHALAVSGAVGAAVLLPRVLLHAHPLQARVQVLGLIALATTLALTIPPSLWFIGHEMQLERDILIGMAERLDGLSANLRAAAQFNYAAARFSNRSDEANPVLARLAMPSTVNLPDDRRWKAAAILESERRMDKGRLERSVRDFADAIRDALLSGAVPPLRGGRYRPRDREMKVLVRADAARFDRPARLALGYFPSAAQWWGPLRALGRGGLVARHADARRREIEDGLDARRRLAPTFWSAALGGESNAAATPPGDLAKVFAAPLDDQVPAIADVGYWLRLPWSRRADVTPGGSCTPRAAETFSARNIEATADQLTEQQRLSGVTYYVGEMYDVSSALQCFAYHAPFGARTAQADEVIVIELRLRYDLRNREIRVDTPCPSKCWGARSMSASAVPTSVEVLVDVPPSLVDRSDYGAAVEAAFRASVDGPVTVTRDTMAEPDSRQVVRLRIAGQGQP